MKIRKELLTKEQLERYSRQIILSEIGVEGQLKLLKSKVLLVGCGGLGSPCAYYLAAAGVGTIGLVDSDKVELNNLHRQIIHFTKDVGRYKTESAREKLELLNSDVKVDTYSLRIKSENIMKIIKNYDIIVDCSDNFYTKYLLNDTCVMLKKPLVHSGVLRFEGQVTTIVPHMGPCYRCIFPSHPLRSDTSSLKGNGILGVVAGVLGVIQATEVLKYIIGKGDLLLGKLLIFNALEMSFRKITIQRTEDCSVCGKKFVKQKN